MFRWAEWYKEVNAQTGKKAALSDAERCRRYRMRQKLLHGEGIQKYKNVTQRRHPPQGEFKRSELEGKIQISSPISSAQQIEGSSTSLPSSVSSTLSIEVITPLSINRIFSFLRKRGYRIEGLQESYMLSSMAAVMAKPESYLPIFPDVPSNSWDCLFPVVELTFPGEVAYERYPLCFSQNKLDYQPVEDLIKTIETLSSAIVFNSLDDLQIHVQCLKDSKKQKTYKGFMDALDAINRAFASVPPLQGPDTQCIIQLLHEVYGRCLKPNLKSLQGGRENTVYGELMPRFLERLFEQAHLANNSLFVDLGSGVGNVVAQAALTRGCKAFGIELRGKVAAIADTMIKAAIVRSQIWGIPVGKMEVACGDMKKNPDVLEWIQVADLVLINNKIFPPSLNEDIKNLIKFMKPGAVLISLKTFRVCGVNRSGRVKLGAKDVGLMFEVTEHKYFSGDVSWSDEGGDYYVHRKIF